MMFGAQRMVGGSMLLMPWTVSASTDTEVCWLPVQIVGHTIQSAGINSACGGKVHRIDVGMSAGCGGNEPQVLEILNDSQVRRLSERPAVQQPTAKVAEGGSPRAIFN